MIDFTSTNFLIGTGVIIINLIPILTKKYKWLLLTASLSVVMMFLGTLM